MAKGIISNYQIDKGKCIKTKRSTMNFEGLKTISKDMLYMHYQENLNITNVLFPDLSDAYPSSRRSKNLNNGEWEMGNGKWRFKSLRDLF